MAQWSIGICTPIPMVPVDQGTIVKAKVAEAAQRLEAGDAEGSLQSLRESLLTSQDKERHLGLITPEWQRARTGIAMPPGHAAIEVFADGMEVGVARCSAAHAAREAGLKYLFFIDWDTLIPADALLKLSYFLDNNPDYDIASGLYCMKSIPPFPLMWRHEWNRGVDFDWTLGDVIKDGVIGIPMGCCLLRLSLFDKLAQTPDNPWFQTIDKPVFCGGRWGRMMMTEDLWFTKRYTDEIDREHRKIMVDTSVWCEHICHATGRRYTLGEDALPMKRLREKQGATQPPASPAEPTETHVLHVGCGTAPLPIGLFNGHKELRLDIDPNIKPDIEGSITDIPLLNGTVEAVYSSHNLEHLDSHEVPVALSEFYRVLKKDGKVVIEVPDVQSVMAEVPKIGLDGVLYESPSGPISPADVLYGHRRIIASGNRYYAHRTGFTKESLEQALANARFRGVNVLRDTGRFSLTATAIRP